MIQGSLESIPTLASRVSGVQYSAKSWSQKSQVAISYFPRMSTISLTKNLLIRPWWLPRTTTVVLLGLTCHVLDKQYYFSINAHIWWLFPQFNVTTYLTGEWPPSFVKWLIKSRYAWPLILSLCLEFLISNSGVVSKKCSQMLKIWELMLVLNPKMWRTRFTGTVLWKHLCGGAAGW